MYFSCYGSDLQSPEGPVSARRHHHQIDYMLVRELHDLLRGVAIYNHRLNVDGGVDRSSKFVQTLPGLLTNFRWGRFAAGHQFNAEGLRQRMQQRQLCVAGARHELDIVANSHAMIGKVDGEENIPEHVASLPPEESGRAQTRTFTIPCPA